MIAPVMRLAGTLGVVIVCSSLIPEALGGPPLVTDDPETPGRGGWEINISHNIEKTRGEFSMETPLIDINYGLLENDQWKIEFPALFLDPDDGQGRWGVGDLEVGWKYRFFEEDERGFMASIYPQVLTPTGNARLGLGGGRTELLLPLEAGRISSTSGCWSTGRSATTSFSTARANTIGFTELPPSGRRAKG